LFCSLHTLNLEGNLLGASGKASLGRAFLHQRIAGTPPLEVFHVNEWRIERTTRTLGLSVYIPDSVRDAYREEQQRQTKTSQNKNNGPPVSAIHKRVPCHNYTEMCHHRLLPADLVLIAGVLHVCHHVDSLQLSGQPVCGVGWLHNNLLRKPFTKKRASFQVGDKVTADYGSSGTWYNGTVTKCNVDGTYDVEYEDGDTEEGIPASKINANDLDESQASKAEHQSVFDWQGIEALMQVIEHDEHLTSLDLSSVELGGWNGIERPGAVYDVTGIQLLANALKASEKRQSLIDLHVSHNSIQPKGLGILATAMKHNYGLQRLHIDHNPLLTLRQGAAPVDGNTKSKRSRRGKKTILPALTSSLVNPTSDAAFLGDIVKWDTAGLDALMDLLVNIQIGQQNLRQIDMRHTGFDVLGAEIFDYANKMYIPTKLKDLVEICGQKHVALLYDDCADFQRSTLQSGAVLAMSK